MRPVSPSAILRKIEQRDALAGKLRRLDDEIAEAGRAFSFSRGFRVPLRAESLRREAAKAASNG